MDHITRNSDQSGQTLLETIIGIFILTTALSSGLALMIYAFSYSALSQNEIIASNLAREGAEVMHTMRDSNWLSGEVSADTTYNLQGCADIGGKLCYPKAFIGPTYALTDGNKRVLFDSSFQTWSLDSTASYDLFLQSNGTYTHTTNGTSTFARMINISRNTAAPFNASNPEVVVKSIVAWRGKNCTSFAASQDLSTLATSCKVTVEEHLTNWKDFK